MNGAHAQPCHQSRGGTPARAMTEQPDNLRQAVSLTRRRSCKSRKTFGKDLAITPLVPTAPATHSHPDRNWCPLRGKIAKHARVDAMTRTRLHATDRTARSLLARYRYQPARLFSIDRSHVQVRRR